MLSGARCTHRCRSTSHILARFFHLALAALVQSSGKVRCSNVSFPSFSTHTHTATTAAVVGNSIQTFALRPLLLLWKQTVPRESSVAGCKQCNTMHCLTFARLTVRARERESGESQHQHYPSQLTALCAAHISARRTFTEQFR